MITYIYNIVDPVTQAILYVGKTVNLEQRKLQHIVNSHNNDLKQRLAEMSAQGKTPIFNLLETCTENHADTEKKWILHFINLGYELFNKKSDNIFRPRPAYVYEYERKMLSMSIDQTIIDKLKDICKVEKRSQAKTIEILIEEKHKNLPKQ